MFKILVPLSKGFDVEELIKLGADEFYFGIDFTLGLNKRDNPKAQISIDEAKYFLDFKRKYPNIKFFVTLNEAPVDISEKDIYISLEKLVKALKPDAYIVKDFFLIDVLSKLDSKVKFHISSLEQIWNKEGIDYLISILGDKFERFIFPRDVTGLEAYNIMKNYPNLEFEIFALNEWCWNVDGLCSSLHFSAKKIGVPFVCYREYGYNWDDNLKRIIYNRTSCKVCGFWRFKDIENLISLKIVGRGASYQQIKRDLIFLKKVIEFLEVADDETEYKNFCKLTLNKIKGANWCNHCEFNN